MPSLICQALGMCLALYTRFIEFSPLPCEAHIAIISLLQKEKLDLGESKLVAQSDTKWDLNSVLTPESVLLPSR